MSKEIEEMAMDMFMKHHFATIYDARRCAIELVELGYGNIEQTRKETAKEILYLMFDRCGDCVWRLAKIIAKEYAISEDFGMEG